VQAHESELTDSRAPHLDPLGQDLGHLHPREQVLAPIGMVQHHPNDIDRFDMNGNGLPGSTASGVSTGKTLA